MRYVISDIHGKYELFMRLMEKIGFSDSDTLYVLGDIIDKGEAPVRLLKTILSIKDARIILGNHEDMFLKFYRSRCEQTEDFDEILQSARGYFTDGEELTFDEIDAIENLPLYIEERDFICTHAGVPVLQDGSIPPLSSVGAGVFLNDRRFKEPNVFHTDPRCVFFGHTQTNGVCGKERILGYQRDRHAKPERVSDFYKIHLDTGAWCTGTLGCFAIDTLRAYYVSDKK